MTVSEPLKPLTIGEFCQKISRLCFTHHCSVTSWIRTILRNKTVWGHPKSRHLTGYGIDLVPDDWGTVDALMKDVRELGFLAINEGDHIHVQSIGVAGRFEG